MPQDDHASSDPDKADSNNDHTLHGDSLPKIYPIGLGRILLVGGILLGTLLFVSIFVPNMSERIKFFTVNALSLLVLIAIAIQAYIYKRQWDAMQGQLDEMRELKAISNRQAKTFEEQRDKMQGQLTVMQQQEGVMQRQFEAMKEQVTAMQDSLAETRKIVNQNERAVTAAEMTAETTRQALYISERPYVEVTDISVSLPFVADTPIIYSVTIENKGRTPAYDLKNVMYIDVRPDPLPENPNYRPLRTSISSVTLGPANPINSKQTTSFTLPQDMIDRINRGEALVYVYGFMTYRDGLTDITHRTRFCSDYSPEEDRFVVTPYHNDAD